MYRPTVRYDEVFKSYVDSWFHATHLDRNQILRAALFAAAYSKEFHEILKPYMKDVPPPSPTWGMDQEQFWLEQSPKIEAKGPTVKREERNVKRIKTENGGIKIKIE